MQFEAWKNSGIKLSNHTNHFLLVFLWVVYWLCSMSRWHCLISITNPWIRKYCQTWYCFQRNWHNIVWRWSLWFTPLVFFLSAFCTCSLYCLFGPLALLFCFLVDPPPWGSDICPSLTVNRKRFTMEDTVIQARRAMADLLGMCLLIPLEKIAGLCIINLSLSAVSLFPQFFVRLQKADLMIPLQSSQLTAVQHS